jgi:hypothetical protein
VETVHLKFLKLTLRLLLFTVYEFAFSLFPRQQYLLACGLVIKVNKLKNNTPLTNECLLLLIDHIADLKTAIKGTSKESPDYIAYIKSQLVSTFDIDKILAKL